MQNGTEKLTPLLGSLLVLGLIAHICSTCGPGLRRREDLCCVSQTCKGTDFQACLINNTQDKCVPCSPGYYLNDAYDTSNFAEPGLCIPVQDCAQDEIRNADGVCECDRAQGYYFQGGVCILSSSLCTTAGEELNTFGTCSPCKDGFYKPASGTKLCKKKSSCLSNQTSVEGDAKTDRQCYEVERTTSLDGTTSPNQTTNETTEDTSHVVWMAIGIVLGCVIVIIVLFVGFWYYRRQRQSKRADAKSSAEGQTLQDRYKMSINEDNRDEALPLQFRERIAIEHADEEPESAPSTQTIKEGTQIYNRIPDQINKAEPFNEIPKKGLSLENVSVHRENRDRNSHETKPKQYHNKPDKNRDQDSHETNPQQYQNKPEKNRDQDSHETKPKQYQNEPGTSGKKTYEKLWLSGDDYKSEPCDKKTVASEEAISSQSGDTDQHGQTYPKDYQHEPDNPCVSNDQEANMSDPPRTLNYQPHSEADNNAILPGGHQSFPLQPNGIAHNHQDGQVIEHQHDSGLPSDEPNHICGHPSHENDE